MNLDCWKKSPSSHYHFIICFIFLTALISTSKMPLWGCNIGQNESYDYIRHTARTTGRLNLSSDFVKGNHISTALKPRADNGMLKCRHVNVRELFQVWKDKKRLPRWSKPFTNFWGINPVWLPSPSKGAGGLWHEHEIGRADASNGGRDRIDTNVNWTQTGVHVLFSHLSTMTCMWNRDLPLNLDSTSWVYVCNRLTLISITLWGYLKWTNEFQAKYHKM